MSQVFGEHADVTEAVIAELDKMRLWFQDRIDMIEKYFNG